MAFDSVPWFVGGGAIHSAVSARNVAYAAMGGAEGIMEAADLKVSQLTAPGGAVKIAIGGVALRNSYAGGAQQMYAGRNTADLNVNVAATGGVGRSDMVVVRIDDPQYGGQIPADRTIGPYIMAQVISNVNPTYTKASQLGLTYPAIALARIDILANTAGITNAMIKDVRKIARPRRQSFVDVTQATNNEGVVAGQSQAGLALGSYATFARSTPYAVPEWATRAKIIVTASGLACVVGNTVGQIRPVFGGSQIGFDTMVDINWAGSNVRATYVAAGEMAVPAAWRGTNQYAYAQWMHSAGPGYLLADSGSTMIFEIEFLEVAE